MEVSGDSDLPLQGVDLGVDADSTVVSHPEGLDHPLLQSLRHVLLRHMEDPQVRETDGNRKIFPVTVLPETPQRIRVCFNCV